MFRTSILISCFLVFSCAPTMRQTLPGDQLLEVYSQQTPLTDPGKYSYLYDGLPSSYDSLCLLIKRQLIHPMEALQMGYTLDRVIEEGAIETTQQILESLVAKDSSGLILGRAPEDRLLLACHHHAMLLSSILRYRNIPVRMRFGFARYFEKEAGVRFGHVICEVWEADEQRWVLVDPDRHYVDLSPSRFDYAHQAYQNLNKKRLDYNVYVSSIGDGLKGVVNLVALDAAHVLHRERMHWIYPEIALEEIRGFEDLEKKDRAVLEEAAIFLRNPDLNFHLLDSLYTEEPGFHPSDLDYEDYCRMMEERQDD